LDFQVLLKQFKKLDKQDEEERQSMLASAAAGPGGGAGGKKPGKSADPRQVQIPKVKMARADDATDQGVVHLLEHIKNVAQS
jgi:hypothetical protein